MWFRPYVVNKKNSSGGAASSFQEGFNMVGQIFVLPKVRKLFPETKGINTCFNG
jgi:hypothetical protein